MRMRLRFVDPAHGLVHEAFDGYSSKRWVVDGLTVSAIGHTHCGYAITCDGTSKLVVYVGALSSTPMKQEFTPRYTSADEPLTCVSCVAQAGDGHAQRAAYKNAWLGLMYSSSTAPMSAHMQVVIDALDRDWIRSKSRSTYRRCSRIAGVLYVKALEEPDARGDDLALARWTASGASNFQDARHARVHHAGHVHHVVRGQGRGR